MPQGNFTAYQQLKPTESKVGDIYASNIDYMIKLGEAEKARKMKELADRNASLNDFSKSIKIEAKETDKYLTDMNVKLTADTTKVIGNAMYNAYNSTNDGEKQKWMRIAQNASESYKAVQNTFGGTNFLKMVNEARTFAETGEAFDQSEQMKLTKAFESNLWKNKINDDGTISFFAKTGDNVNDPDREYTVGEMAIIAQSQAEVNLLEDTKTAGKGLYSYMSDVAGKMMDEYTKDPTGNRTISKKEFARKKGEIDFDTQFGGFNINRPKYDKFGQFSIKTLGRLPTSEAEHEQVRQAYVDKLWSYTSATEKDVVTKNALEIAQQKATLRGTELSNIDKALDIQNPNRKNSGGGSSAPQGFTSISNGMVNNKGNVVVQIRDSKGNVKGVQRWSSATTGLPKVKGYPGTDNSFGLSYFKNKKGETVPTFIMGASAPDGSIVYSKITPSEFSTYVSKSGYDPYKLANTLSENRAEYGNKYSSQVDARNESYKTVKIGYKAKQDNGDSTDPLD